MTAGTRLPGTPRPMHYWRGHAGIRLAGDSWGVAGSPLVLLLHGAGQTRHAWRSLGRGLADAGYYAIAFDARGHGDSDWAPDGIYSVDVMVEDLRSISMELGSGSPTLVGASMGGGTSLVAVGEGRVRARALVLVDIAPRIEADGVARVSEFMSYKPNGFDSLAEVADAIARYQPHRPRPKNLVGLGKNVRLAPDGKYRWHWDPKLQQRKQDPDARAARLEACASQLAIPTLLVRGEASDVLSEEGAHAFKEYCPTAQLVDIPSAGHMVAGDRNDAFRGAVLDFVARAVPPTRDGRVGIGHR